MSRDNKQKQIEIAERLQLKLLENFEELLASNTITPTDRATLARLLSSNGWNIDPHSLPKGLKDLMRDLPDPRVVDDEDPRVN